MKVVTTFLLVVGLALFTLSCGDEDPEPVSPVTTEDVLDDPDAYYGETVTIRADVTRAEGAYVLLLGDGNLPAILTIDTRHELYQTIEPGDVESAVVEIDGTIRRFDAAQLGQELGVELSEYSEMNGQAVLVADSIEASPEFENSGD